MMHPIKDVCIKSSGSLKKGGNTYVWRYWEKSNLNIMSEMGLTSGRDWERQGGENCQLALIVEL